MDYPKALAHVGIWIVGGVVSVMTKSPDALYASLVASVVITWSPLS